MQAYLDNSATTRPHDRVIEIMVASMETGYGNPSSLHRMGMEAEQAVSSARKQVAGVFGCREDEVFFTGSGTEANNMALMSGAMAGSRRGKKIITSKGEHPSVLETFRYLEGKGFRAVYIDIDKNGLIDLEQLEKEVDDDTILISVMHVNNEVGTLQPIEAIAQRKGKALFHTDCVQSFGKLTIPMKGVDLISLSGHKIHGPKGIGALYVRKGLHLPPFIHGGGQERGLRSGTENVPAIVGLGLAGEIAAKHMERSRKHVEKLNHILRSILLESGIPVKINSPRDGIPHILNVSFEKTRGEVLLHKLEQHGVYVSTGSACSSNKKGKSHVLQAMGLSAGDLEGALRISMSPQNTEEEIRYAGEKMIEAVSQFRKLGSYR